MTETTSPSESLKERMAGFHKTLEKAMKFKAVMIKKGLKVADTPCWNCDGQIRGRLYPNRRDRTGFHLHMSCNGPCKTAFME